MQQKNNSGLILLAAVLTVIMTNIYTGNLSAQKKEDKPAADSTLLKGYFLLYRKSIHNEPDHTEPRASYKIFFVERLTDTVLSDFIDLDSLRDEIKDVGSSVADINVLNHKITIEAFNGTNTVNDAPFYFSKTVADYLINNNDRFIAVYYGTLLAKGPYQVMGNVLRRKASGYIYIRSRLNQVKYLYSISLPKSTEQKSYLLPHA